MKQYKKTLAVMFLLGGFVFILTKCMHNAQAAPDPRGRMYAGSTSCKSCHKEISDSFVSTAHHLATSQAVAQNLLADFDNKNLFAYDSLTEIVMEKRGNDFFQILYIAGKEKAAYKFDIVFGARNAQTFVYWKNDQTFELPLSWYTSVHAWGTSPGFPSDIPRFDRLVNTDCYDCHSSSLNLKLNTSINTNMSLDSASLIYGIDCERCHGPAANHVNYHTAYPEQKMARYISTYASFTREQKLDACAVCHAGNDKAKIQSRFQFKMGDTLDQFFMPNTGKKNILDVHGNQHGLMVASKCFISTGTLNCGTCHEPHKNATKDLAIYSQKCLNCHNEQLNQKHCPKMLTVGASIKQNCIDCHMPKLPSTAIGFQMPGKDGLSAYLLRTHKIGIWEDQENKK